MMSYKLGVMSFLTQITYNQFITKLTNRRLYLVLT